MSNKTLLGKMSLVIGGTNGIGRGLTIWLAEQGSSVIVAGRSRERGQEVVEEMRAITQDIQPPPTFEFAPIDMFLVADTNRFAEEFRRSHDRLDYLVITSGIATTQGRTETPEGIDQKLAIHYYSRVAATLNLLPLMEKTASEGGDTRVLSVLSAGMHSPYAGYRQDPELKTQYSLKNAADLAGFYNDLALDSLAREHPSVTFAHADPGAVKTAWGSELNPFLRGLVRFVQLFFKSPAECARLIGPSLTSPDFRGGFRLLSSSGTPTTVTNLHEEAREFVWSHTKELLDRIQKSKLQERAESKRIE